MSPVHTLSHHHPDNVAADGAEGQTDADFLLTLRDGNGQNAAYPERREQHRDSGEHAKQLR